MSDSGQRVPVDERQYLLGRGFLVSVDHEIGLAGRVVEMNLDQSFSTKSVGLSD
jgi:hypothetical protein